MFDDTGLLAHHGIGPEKMKAFVSELARRYKKVPYHHFTHTFSLMQMLYSFLNVAKHSKEGSPFTKSEELVLYLAALGHDLGHCKFGMTRSWNEQPILPGSAEYLGLGLQQCISA